MNRSNQLTLSGLMMVVAGLVILLSNAIGPDNARIAVPALFVLGGVFAFSFATSNAQHRLASQYHKIQGGGMTLFALLIALIPQSLEEFLMYVVYFILANGFVELIYAFNTLNTTHNISRNILIWRMLSGIAGVMGALMLMALSWDDQGKALLLAGALTGLGGIGFVAFAMSVRKHPA